MKKLCIRVFAMALVIMGSLIWGSRLEYRPDVVMTKALGAEIVRLNPNRPTDLSGICEQTRTDSGWVLFLVEANVWNDTKSRLYFETAPKPYGLWLESGPGVLQVGLGLGDDVISSSEIPVRVVRSDSREFVAIGVTSDETRVIANAVDNVSQWPGAIFPQWRCDSVQIGNSLRQLSEGDTCENCDAIVSVVSGQGVERLDSILDSIVNIERFSIRRWSGTLLILLGVALLTTRLKRCV
jgi:hypothetical protein